MKKKRRKTNASDTRRVVLVAFLAVAVLVLAVVFFRSGGQERIRAKTDAPSEGPGVRPPSPEPPGS